ncbi:DUF202 domain-containing protein [Knoellia subterranea]|uniref:DUF202 domain-containing protein n=1 Tax=Knoellia subterranea KCTC 19937 TaxID=1385521 RepID=A0A0A0JJY0_9MICO|nr:DUF202 domain-containing protein [Knoellia subterranea]KGN37715.1 hypothetical protein N803_11700 [Knoellia subterranea KCTC 19937]
MTEEPTPRTDDGLQPERTSLAWQRTAISFVGASLLFLRWGQQHGPAVAVVVVVAGLVATWIFFHARIRLRRVGRLFPAPGLDPATMEIGVVTAAVLALAIAALCVTLS